MCVSLYVDQKHWRPRLQILNPPWECSLFQIYSVRLTLQSVYKLPNRVAWWKGICKNNLSRKTYFWKLNNENMCRSVNTCQIEVYVLRQFVISNISVLLMIKFEKIHKVYILKDVLTMHHVWIAFTDFTDSENHIWVIMLLFFYK